MANNPPNRGWRKAADSGQAKSAKRGWQQDATATGPSVPKLSKRAKLGLTIGAVVLVLGGIIWLFYLLRGIKPVQIVVIGAGYEDTHLVVPPNPYGKGVQKDLEEWASKFADLEGKRRLDVRSAEVTADGDPYAEALKEAKDKGSPTVVLFLTGLGGADEKGPYLLPKDASLTKPDKVRQRMDKLFDQLKLLPGGMNKVLIVDVAQVPSSLDLGMIHNDFARAFLEDARGKQIENLLVITSCDEQQRSWVSEDWRQSIFAHFLIEGLKGAADETKNGGDGNDRVSVQELYDYVAKNVKHWARHNRDALQEPVLVGDKDLAAKVELVLLPGGYSYQAPDPDKLKEFSYPAEMTAAWKESQRLADLNPPPAAYAPQLWRQYLDSLLRAEQLYRADDKEDADRLREDVKKLGERIEQAGQLARDSYQFTLAMPAALGRGLPADQEKKLRADVDKLWDDKDPQAFKKKLSQYQDAATEKWQKQLLRDRLSAIILERIAAEPASLDAGCKVLAALDETLNPRAAEVQFTILLNRDLNEKRPPAELLTKAVEVRLKAEQAALGAGGKADASLPSYCEQVAPWTREKVDAADQKRRQAQDLLLAAEPRHWKQAGDWLDESDKSYDAVQTDSVQIRKALKARDETLSTLPYYTEWLARQRADDPALEAQITGLWKSVHELRAILDRPDPQASAAKIKDLSTRASDLDKGLAQLRDDGKARAEKLTGESLQKGWHAIEAALTVPFIDADIRRQLVQRSRKISAELNVETAKSSEAAGVTPEQNAKMARETAQRWGRLALAMLGEDEFKRQQPSVSYADVEGDVKRPGEDKWWKALVKAGDQIGQRFTQLAADADRLTQEGRQVEPDKAATALHTAGSLGHLASGAGAGSLLSLDPVGEDRRLRLHDLLCWQAERTFSDYLASDDPKNPYYRAVGLAFTRDAADLAGKDAPDLTSEQKDRRLSRVAKLDKLLKSPDTLEILLWDGSDWKPGPANLDLTAEKPEERLYRVKAPATVPDGIPVVWAKPGAHVKVTREAGGGPADPPGRVVLEQVGAKRQEVQVPTYSIVQAGTTAPTDKTEQVLAGLYRGRRFQHKTEVFLFQRPDLVLLQPETPRTARVAVQADAKLMAQFGADKSAIAIVLDCSGSMNEKKPGQKESRFVKVVNALEKVLEKLKDGVMVSLWVFAHDDPQFLDQNPGMIPIRQLRKPRKWIAPSELSPGDLKPLMTQVRALKPSYETPLVRAIWTAKKDLANFKGSRTIVVLTDGADSEFYKKEEKEFREKGSSIAKFFQNEFSPELGINVNVVSVEVSKNEQRQQKEFKDAVEGVGGRCFEVENSDEVVRFLSKALLQMRFWIETSDGKVPANIPPEGADSSRYGENLRWIKDLAPGVYQLRVRTNRDSEQRIRLEAGDSLILNLIDNGSDIGFQRDVYAESLVGRLDKEPKMARTKDGWLLGVLQNQRKVALLPNRETLEGTQLMATLEKPEKGAAPKGGTLRVLRPGFVWFETPKPEKGQVPNLRFYPLADYPAPAWGLDISPWQRGTPVLLDAYFSDDLPEGSARVLRSEQDKFTSVVDLVNRPVDVVLGDEQVKVTIESVRAERLAIERKAPADFNKPGEIEKDVDCLVIRLRVPQGKLFYVQVPESLGAVGQEHRFYTQAGKYTGVFWKVTREQAQALKSLTLVSIDAAKKKATRVQNLDLGAPDVQWGRPHTPENKN